MRPRKAGQPAHALSLPNTRSPRAVACDQMPSIVLVELGVGFRMPAIIHATTSVLRDAFRSPLALRAEILARQHQLTAHRIRPAGLSLPGPQS